MSDQQTETAPLDRFMEAARQELDAFERRETAFRKKDREQRAERLRIPLSVGDLH